MSERFIPHALDAAMPVHPDVMVDVQFADGRIARNMSAGTWGPHTACDDCMWSWPWREEDRVVGWRPTSAFNPADGTTPKLRIEGSAGN